MAIRLTILASLVSCSTLLFGFFVAAVFDGEQLGASTSLQAMYDSYGGAIGLLFVNGIVGPVLEELVFRNALGRFSASRITVSSTVLLLFMLDRTESSAISLAIYMVYGIIWIGVIAQLSSKSIRTIMINYWEKYFSYIFLAVTLAFVLSHYSPLAIQNFSWTDSGIVALGFADRLLLSSLAGYLRVKTGALWAPIIVHSAPNMLLAVLFLSLRG